jgi:hypothetical protein
MLFSGGLAMKQLQYSFFMDIFMANRKFEVEIWQPLASTKLIPTVNISWRSLGDVQ